MERETVPCKWCGNNTLMTATELCDSCWELYRRIEANPDLAFAMLKEFNQKEVK